MMSRTVLFRYLLLLIILLLAAYFVHSGLLQSSGFNPDEVLLGRAYLVNAILAGLILGIIYVLRKKLFSQIGFLFLAGSMLKFLFFFLLFNPHYKADGLVSKPEFIGFFIPYGLSLIIETLAVSKLLKSKPGTDS